MSRHRCSHLAIAISPRYAPPMRAQYSLRSLVGVVVACAIFFAIAIRPPLELGNVALSVTVVMLFASVFEAVFRHGEERYFWTGFAIVGWGYVVLVFSTLFTEIGDHLLTTQLLMWIHRGSFESVRFGQSLITMLVALVGGFASRHYVKQWKAPLAPQPQTSAPRATNASTNLFLLE
jgi:hypothetical protein